MKVIKNTCKKKLAASLILFLISVVLWVIAVYYLFSYLFGGSDKINITATVIMAICYFILLFISIFLNMSYRKNSIKSGALSTVLLIVSLIILIGPFGIIMFCVMYYFGGKKQKSLTAKDEEGNVFILTQSSEWSDDYRDQNGDWWKTRDGGKTFEREITVEN